MKVLLLLLFAFPVYGEIIAPSNRVDWVVRHTVGSQVAPVWRSSLLNVVSGFGADVTGVNPSHTNIQAAIDTAVAGDVIYLPNGLYKLEATLTLNKSNVTFRGESTNAILWQKGSQAIGLSVGHDAVQYAQAQFHRVNSASATKGSTNLAFYTIDDGSGGNIVPGDSFIISDTMYGSDTWNYINDFGYTNSLKHVVVCHTISSTNITITAPLAFAFTNYPIAQSFNRYGGVGNSERMRTGIGLENFSMTTTNGGVVGSGSTLIAAGMIRDSWFTNVNLRHANNFWLDIQTSANIEIKNCWLGNSLTAGPNHSGLRLSTSVGVLVENSIFADGLFPAIEYWSASVVNSALFGLFMTNNGSSILYHNTHHMMNLTEACNLAGGRFTPDGYFGATSHETAFRNALLSFDLKRWATHMQVVGNVVGDSAVFYTYDELFTRGVPNIGNDSYDGNSPPKPWNWPGDKFTYNGTTNNPNGIFVLTNSGTGTVIPGIFTNLVTFSTDPNYPILFQDGVDTNVYHWLGNAPFHATTITPSNMTVNQSVSWTNGQRVFSGGNNSWQQRQYSNLSNDVVHGNLIYTNSGGTLVWDSGIADHDLVDSILYPSGQPGWWGTNRWPAIDPENTLIPLVPNPAEDRYYGRSGGSSTVGTIGVSVSSGVTISSGVSFK